jgi:hypothetical protein
MTDFENDIENLRNKLYRLLDNKELTDTKVVVCSQELDKVLVEYEKMNFSKSN